MNYNDYKELLKVAFETNGHKEQISNDSVERFYRFSNLLVETNKQFNLTAITDETEIILKHFVDCASIITHIPTNSTLVDVGCGAGFPSIPVAIMRPDVKVTALDSTQKRIDFVNFASKELGLTNVNGVCARAEEFASAHRECFDVCTSRAVARLNVLAELCIPLVKPNGIFIAMKSIKGGEEYAEATRGIDKLGCSLALSQRDLFSFEGLNAERTLLIFKKERATPREFPRRYAQILKKPL